ncbi:MAG: DUF3365 domain-containing protein [Proteobacteria bacterium]|nr:DUF3365 domain-containing protein [Pseudomonadota bacterium]
MLGNPAPRQKSAQIWPYVLALAVLGTLLFGLSLWWNLTLQQRGLRNTALTLARTTLQKDVFYRRWNSQFGGVYAPTGPAAPPNPYLKVPERDIQSPSGRSLTMINPAYMTRQVHELEAKGTGVRGHITSLNPIRPGNAPDAWERQALLKVERGAKEHHEIVEIDGQPALRLLKPLYVEKPCLRCHQAQGYSLGQVRGGLSVTVPMGVLLAQGRQEIRGLILTHLLLWAATMLAMLVAAVKLQRRISERDQARREAQTLSGLLPICSHCKSIRDADGQWQKLESYIARHSEADFSHGLCPQCLAEHYPDVPPYQAAPSLEHPQPPDK